MPYRNRVTPMGDIVSIPLRGAWTGNRGRLHEWHADRGAYDIVRPFGADLWITCALRFKDRKSELWRPRRFTWLFFLDEAVSFAAGHRPCGECRYRAYTTYRDLWADTVPGPFPTARQMNRQLHGERLVERTRERRLHELEWNSLPDGTFVRRDGNPAVVLGDRLVDWTTEGYRTRHARPVQGSATVLTPPSTVAILRAGYPVQIDDGAR